MYSQGDETWSSVVQEVNGITSSRNVAYTSDEGQTWSFVGTSTGPNYPDPPARSLVKLNGRLFAASGAGLYVSTDGGKIWAGVKTESPFTNISQLTTNGQLLIAARYDYEGAVLLSADYGVTWQTSPVQDLKGIACRNDSLFAYTSSAILLSTNAGKTWTKLLDSQYSIQQIAVTNTGSLLVTSNRDGFRVYDLNRQAWRIITLTSRLNQTEQPSTRLLAVTDKFWFVSTDYTRNVYASTDQGKTWIDISAGLPTDRRRYISGLTALSVSNRSVFTILGPSIWRRDLSELQSDYVEFPDSLVATTSPRDQTVLTWRDNSLTETGFRIERGLSETGPFAEIARLPANVTQYTDTDVANGPTYYYRLRTEVNSQLSGYSPVLTAIRPVRSCQSINRIMGTSFSDVQMVTDSRGYLVEENSDGSTQQQLLETLDGGKSWHAIFPRLGRAYFSFVRFNGTDRGYIVSGSGNLLQTRDGGKSWREALTANTFIRAPHFVDDKIGFTAGQNGMIYATTDAGDTWIGRESRLRDPSSIWFINQRVGYATAGNSVLKTNDGGYSWVPVFTDNQSYATMQRVWFKTESVGFAFGNNGLIKTTNAGETWSRLSVSSRTLAIMDLKQNAAGHLFVSGLYPGPNQSIGQGSFLFKSVDQGATWDSVAVPARGYFTRLSFSGQTGCLVGPERSIAMSYDGGASWQSVSHDPYSVRAVSRINQSIVSATRTGAKAIVLWSRDGGESWQNYEIAQPQVLNGTVYVKQINPERVIVLTDYLVSQTNDGGRTWASRSLPMAGKQFYNLVIVNERIMYGVIPRDSRDGLDLLKTTDGGLSWRILPTPFNPNIAMSFLDENNGLVNANYIGDMYKTSDGGQTWQKLRVSVDGKGMFPSGLQLVTPAIAFAWESELLYKTDNGGQTWQSVNLSSTQLPASSSQPIHSCLFVNTNLGYMHRSGQLYKTEDGGRTWRGMGGLAAGNGFAQITADDEFLFLSNNYYGALGKVLLRETPAMPHEPIGKVVGCLGTQQTYSITNQDAYSYEWQLLGGGQLAVNRSRVTIAVTTPGTYTLTVRSLDECGVSDVKAIQLPVRTRPATPVWEAQALSPCPATSVSYSVRPVDQLSYDWRINDSLLVSDRSSTVGITWPKPGAHTYVLSVVGNDGFCSSDPVSSTVIVKSLPVKPLVSQSGSGELQTNFTGQVQWTFRGQPIPGATNQKYTANQGTGFYAVRAINECGYTLSDSAFLMITALENGLVDRVTVFPNPTQARLSIDVTHPRTKPLPLTLTTLSGQPMISRSLAPGTVRDEIDVSGLPTATYLLIVGDDKERAVYKIIKQ
ncbi:YCF48-related protein [Spirosoma sp. KUDC1026]|uniref:YCF48-related protein n=1 Tax=Spirosoma sp. KUDC1026 TaxID=2745947 RepID=UPI00159BA465|nr:YCF48-related protein [Spirosoma sp. KUDC1026]QKZ13570.1 T9SS type A sorting domain-containing protein [Spirosoma sp. KUDC1026]